MVQIVILFESNNSSYSFDNYIFYNLTPIALLSKVFKTKSNFLSKDQIKTAYKNQIKQFDKKSFEKAW